MFLFLRPIVLWDNCTHLSMQHFAILMAIKTDWIVTFKKTQVESVEGEVGQHLE